MWPIHIRQVSHSILNRTTAEFFKNRDMHLVLWTVNDPMEKQYFGECLKVPYMTDTLLN